MGDKPVREIVVDLCGAALAQSTLERIINEANAPGDEQLVTITIKNIHRHPGFAVPRLIADHGDLIHSIVVEMKRREEERYANERTPAILHRP